MRRKGSRVIATISNSPELLTVSEVAAILRCSPAAVSRRFRAVPGVVNLAGPSSHRRAYRVLRIPRAVLDYQLRVGTFASRSRILPDSRER